MNLQKPPVSQAVMIMPKCGTWVLTALSDQLPKAFTDNGQRVKTRWILHPQTRARLQSLHHFSCDKEY